MKNKLTLIFKLLFILLISFSCNRTPSFQQKVDIVLKDRSNKQMNLAANILQRYLNQMSENIEIEIVDEVSKNDYILLTNFAETNQQELSTNFPSISLPTISESFSLNGIKTDDKSGLVICSYDQRGLLYAVYETLEKLGCRFYLSEEFIPKIEGVLKFDKINVSNAPLTGERIVFNWHNFLSGITSWNMPEYKQWIDATVKMKYNTLMFHAYGSDPFINYSLNGAKKENGLVPSSIKGRDWGISHVNNIQNLYGGDLFDDTVFGSDVSKMDEDTMEKESVKLLQNAFKYANERSLDINFGFDISTATSNPQNLLKTLPKSAQLNNYGGSLLANPEEKEGYEYFKSQIVGLLADYPQITHITPWVRYMKYPKGGVYIAVKNMPKEWQQQYQKVLEENPSFKKDAATNSFFYIGKVLEAYKKVLKEIGREDVKLGLGTWNWVSFPFLDKFIPENVSFYPIDWDMDFNTENAQIALTKIKKERKVYPVIWAHHDDHSYIGRPFEPPVNLVKKLEERYAEGFGILHWTTYPLDMYFKNISQQTWSKTANESYTSTIKEYAENGIKSNSAEFNKYLELYYLEAPHFGRETSDHFFHMYFNEVGKSLFPVYDPISIGKFSKKRLALLKGLNNSDISKTKTYKYFKNMEEFYILFFENQQMLIDAAGICMNGGDLKIAGDIMGKTAPEKAVLKYAEAIKYGPNTLGEQSIILRLNLNWLPDFVDIKQKTGVLPIQYKFHPTNHEAIAQRGGNYTWYFEKDKNFTMCLGEKETNGATITEENNGALKLDQTLVSFPVGYWRKVEPNYWSDTFKDFKLIAGNYILKINTNALSANNNGLEMNIELRNDKGKVLNKNTRFKVKNNEVSVPFAINHSLLNISMKASVTTIELTGFTIERVK